MDIIWDKVNTLKGDKKSYKISELIEFLRSFNLKTSGNKLELVNRLLTKKHKEDLPHKYLIGMINEYLTVEESITFKENTDDEISFEDYTDFQQKKKILKEFKDKDGGKCFKHLIDLNEKDEKLLRKCGGYFFFEY